MNNLEDIKLLVDYCRKNLQLEKAKLSDEYYYNSLTLCIIDAVYSIGVNYKSVQNVVDNYCEYNSLQKIRNNKSELPALEEQEPIQKLVDNIKNLGIDKITNEVFKNKQRTSSIAGILKSEAVYKFASVLLDFDVNFFQDIYKIQNNKDFEKNIKDIAGQKSGISLDYFFMLAGDDNFIKVDRMILRFIDNALNKNMSYDQCQALLVETSKILQIDFPFMTPRLLDHLIWQTQRLIKD